MLHEFNYTSQVYQFDLCVEYLAFFTAFLYRICLNVCLCFNTHLQKGYDDLQSIVPTCQQQSEFAMAAQKISKATVLQKSKSLQRYSV